MPKTEAVDENAVIRMTNHSRATYWFEVPRPKGSNAEREILMLGDAANTDAVLRERKVVRNAKCPSPVAELTLRDWRRLGPANHRVALGLAALGEISISADFDLALLPSAA